MALVALRDIHLAGAGIWVEAQPVTPGEYRVEPKGGFVIVNDAELRRFALEILKLVGE